MLKRDWKIHKKGVFAVIVKLKQMAEDGEYNFKDIDISSDDIRLAKRCVAEFLETLKTKTENLKQPQLYYVTLLTLRIMSEQVLNEIGTDRLEEVFSPKQ